MGGYISFAKFNKKHLYILYSILFLILKDFSFGFNYNDSFEPLIKASDEKANENFSEHFLIKNILCYIFTFIFSLILYVFERKKIEKNLKNKSENGDNALVSPSFSQIKYIHHVSKNIYLSNKSILFLLFIIFMWILNENLLHLFSILKDLDFWMIEIIIISYMTSFFFKTKIYIHHKMIIYLNLFPFIFKIITIILSFKDDCNKNDDFVVVTSRDTIKRMKTSEVILTKRARSGTQIIKKVKANPYYVIDAAKLTPNQYKENVPVYLIYNNGNDEMEAFSLKYNVSDAGKQIDKNGDFDKLIGVYIKEPSKPDEAVSPDYLEEPDLFTQANNSDQSIDLDIADEKPLVTPKAKQVTNQSILDELDAILQRENVKKPEGTIEQKVDESNQTEEKKIKYTKISLFDDFDN